MVYIMVSSTSKVLFTARYFVLLMTFSPFLDLCHFGCNFGWRFTSFHPCAHLFLDYGYNTPTFCLAYFFFDFLLQPNLRVHLNVESILTCLIYVIHTKKLQFPLDMFEYSSIVLLHHSWFFQRDTHLDGLLLESMSHVQLVLVPVNGIIISWVTPFHSLCDTIVISTTQVLPIITMGLFLVLNAFAHHSHHNRTCLMIFKWTKESCCGSLIW